MLWIPQAGLRAWQEMRKKNTLPQTAGSVREVTEGRGQGAMKSAAGSQFRA